jgi:hypothetical protein
MASSSLFDGNALGQFDGQSDVGTVRPAGSCVYDALQQRYALSAAGQNVWGQHDDFHFVWKRMAGDFIVTAQAALLGEGVNPHRKLGWMVRKSLDAGSPNACTGIHGDGLLTLQFRHTQDGPTGEVRSTLQGADVVQLERKATRYILSVARYGEPFQSVQVEDLDLGHELYVGLYLCSHEEDVVEHAVFSNVRIVVPVQEGFSREKDRLGSHLELLDIPGGRREVIYSAGDVFEAPNWMRDGSALIFNRGGRLYRFDLESRTPELIDTGSVVHNNNDHVLSFDGTMLAISSHGTQDRSSLIYTVPVKGGDPTLITPQGPSYLHGWSPDGQHLVYTALRRGDYDIYRIPSAGGEEEQLTTELGLDDGPEYTPDGRYIYFNSVRSGSMQIWRMLADGSRQEQLTDDEFNNWFPHISPDGKSVIFVSYLPGETAPSDHPAAKRVYLRLMPLEGGTPQVVAYLYGGQGTMNVPSWSPDGKRVAFVSNTAPAP